MSNAVVYGHLEWLDYVIISFYLVACVVIGVSLIRRGTKDTESY